MAICAHQFISYWGYPCTSIFLLLALSVHMNLSAIGLSVHINLSAIGVFRVHINPSAIGVVYAHQSFSIGVARSHQSFSYWVCPCTSIFQLLGLFVHINLSAIRVVRAHQSFSYWGSLCTSIFQLLWSCTSNFQYLLCAGLSTYTNLHII